VSLTINGQIQDLEIDPRNTLLDLLREDPGSGGVRTNRCLSLAVSHEVDEITTIEGLESAFSVGSFPRARWTAPSVPEPRSLGMACWEFAKERHLFTFRRPYTPLR